MVMAENAQKVSLSSLGFSLSWLLLGLLLVYCTQHSPSRLVGGRRGAPCRRWRRPAPLLTLHCRDFTAVIFLTSWRSLRGLSGTGWLIFSGMVSTSTAHCIARLDFSNISHSFAKITTAATCFNEYQEIFLDYNSALSLAALFPA